MVIRLPGASRLRAILALLFASSIAAGTFAGAPVQQPPATDKGGWQPLFDGKTLANWQALWFAATLLALAFSLLRARAEPG